MPQPKDKKRKLNPGEVEVEKKEEKEEKKPEKKKEKKEQPKKKEPKVSKVEEEDDDECPDAIDYDLVEEIQKYQDEIDNIDKQNKEKILAIEKKYQAQKKPIYARREALYEKLPDFWSRAWFNHPILASTLNSTEDQEIFKCLKKLVVDKTEFEKVEITFIFQENPYLSSTTLVKKYVYEDSNIVDMAGTDLKWKPGKEPKVEEGKEDEQSFLSVLFDEQDTEDLMTQICEFWEDPFSSYRGELIEIDEDDEEDEEDEDEGEE